MARNGWKWLMGLALAGLVPLSEARAEPAGIATTAAFAADEKAPPSDKERIARLEAEIAHMKAGGSGGCCDAPKVNCEDDGCKRCGIVGGAEIVFLKPYNNEGVPPVFDLFGFDPDYGLEPSYRLWLGANLAGGIGFRVRFWEFDHNKSNVFDGPFGNTQGDSSIEAKVLDLEVTDTFALNSNYRAVLSAGVRYVDYDESASISDPETFFGPSFGGGYSSQSTGLTLGAELHRRLFRNLSLYVAGRGSVLFGDEDETISFGLGIGIPTGGAGPLGGIILDATENEENNVKYIWEAALGLEWNREMAGGGILFFRGTYEAQFWDNFSGNIPILNSSGSVGFGGFGLAAGIRR